MAWFMGAQQPSRGHVSKFNSMQYEPNVHVSADEQSKMTCNNSKVVILWYQIHGHDEVTLSTVAGCVATGSSL